MTPVVKAIALVLIHPELATNAPDHDTWMNSDDPDQQLLGKILQLLHERPHYSTCHILSFWSGKEEYPRLNEIANNDLLQSTNAFSAIRDNKPPKLDYDPQPTFVHCIETLRRHQSDKQSAAALEKLKSINTSLLSKEEKAKWALAALKPKK